MFFTLLNTQTSCILCLLLCCRENALSFKNFEDNLYDVLKDEAGKVHTSRILEVGLVDNHVQLLLLMSRFQLTGEHIVCDLRLCRSDSVHKCACVTLYIICIEIV
jgi:hypothetical protein